MFDLAQSIDRRLRYLDRAIPKVEPSPEDIARRMFEDACKEFKADIEAGELKRDRLRLFVVEITGIEF